VTLSFRSAASFAYTGTPAGVGPVKPRDVIDVTIEGLTPLQVIIGERESSVHRQDR
jgi:2-keto-4-pentenoate hydratase/2-oxohepta-3-ene-1,7-dioic acid hydratase in catechol pathway